MTLSAVTGPCGLTPSQLIDIAGGLRRGSAGVGMTCADQLNGAFHLIGMALTEELRRDQGESAIPSYETRLSQVAPIALKALLAPDVFQQCVAIGGSKGRALKESHHRRCIMTLLAVFKHLQTALDASTSEMLDILAWVQVILFMKRFGTVPPVKMPRKSRSKAFRRH